MGLTCHAPQRHLNVEQGRPYFKDTMGKPMECCNAIYIERNPRFAT